MTNKAADFIAMTKALEEYGYQEVNLNLGCPSRTVVTKGRGAGFLSVGIRAVAKRCGITKHITWHQSRHTAATTIFLSNGVPIETVSSMLGHKSIKTTQIYAKITKEKLNQDMENLAARLNGVEEFAGCTI